MKRRQHGKVLYKIVGAIAGLAFIVFGAQERLEISSIHKRGKRAVIEPVAQYTQFKQRGSSTYTAEIRFKTEDGRQMAVKHSFPEGALADFKANRPVEIVYLPADPGTFVFASEKASWTLVAIGAAVLVAALLFA
jgi:hypothetical protein